MMEKKIELKKKRVETNERLYQEEKLENENEHILEVENDEFSTIVDGNDHFDTP